MPLKGILERWPLPFDHQKPHLPHAQTVYNLLLQAQSNRCSWSWTAISKTESQNKPFLHISWFISDACYSNRTLTEILAFPHCIAHLCRVSWPYVWLFLDALFCPPISCITVWVQDYNLSFYSDCLLYCAEALFPGIPFASSWDYCYF